MASSKLSYVSTIRDDIPTHLFHFTSKLSYTHLFSFLRTLLILRTLDILVEDPSVLEFLRDDLSSSKNFIIIIFISSSSSSSSFLEI